MKTIQTTAIVSSDGSVTVHLPPGIPPGEHKIVMVVEEAILPEKKTSLNLPVDNYGPWPKNLSLRREDLYGSDGR